MSETVVAQQAQLDTLPQELAISRNSESGPLRKKG